LKKVAVIRWSSLGDVVLATGIPGVLKRALAGAEVSFVVSEVYSELLLLNPHIDHIVLTGTSSRRPLESLRRRIREIGPDSCIDLQSTLASRLLTLAPGMPRSVRIAKETAKRYCMVAGKGAVGFLRRKPVVETYLAAARECLSREGLRIETADPTPKIYLAPEEIDRARGEILSGGSPGKSSGAGGLLFALCPGSKWATKRWKEEYFAQVAEELVVRYDARVLVLGSREETELGGRVRSMVGAPARERVIACCGDLRKLAAALTMCEVAVSNDSGLMHVAAACGSKVVGLFGPTVTGFGFAPWGNGHRVVEKDVWCKPCSFHGRNRCPLGHHDCMEKILPADVLAAVAEVLGDGGDGQRGAEG